MPSLLTLISLRLYCDNLHHSVVREVVYRYGKVKLSWYLTTTKNSYMHSLIASELYGGMQSVLLSKSFTPEIKIRCGLAGPVWTQLQSEEVPV